MPSTLFMMNVSQMLAVISRRLSTEINERLRLQFNFTRLFVEDTGVIGTGWFAQRREDRFHISANILRIFAHIVLSPFFALTPKTVTESADLLLDLEPAAPPETPGAVLFRPLGGENIARSEVTQLQPTWMVEVKIRQNGVQYCQVAWDDPAVYHRTYTAISYKFESAKSYYIAKYGSLPFRYLPLPPSSPVSSKIPPFRRFSPDDRRKIVTPLLDKYIDLLRKEGGFGDGGTKYIWLDEFCLSDEKLDWDAGLNSDAYENREKEREKEVGRIADIFRGASAVSVFCNMMNCDHTGLDCPWGTGLFTLAEILHAETVLKIIRTENGEYILRRSPGGIFRQNMQKKATRGRKWNLCAIMQHASNPDTVPRQIAIHALLVETILRDEAGGFPNHKYLGKALNGLLPRRARPTDLLGKDGWDDLAWLLELNQGFYNATGLAAVCSLPDKGNGGHGWLGRPIAPSEGRERLEPIAVAFPTPSELTILSPNTVQLPQTVKRDANALYTHEDLVVLKWITRFLLAAFLIGALFSFIFNILLFARWISLLWGGCALCNFMKLAAGTLYIKRSGWLLYRHSEYGEPVEIWLRKRDATMLNLTIWRDSKQLTPTWRKTPLKTVTVSIVDLQNNTLITTDVLEGSNHDIDANALVPLAVHGCGITCMVLHRPDNTRDVAYRVGMVSVPPYVLAHGRKTGSVRIGAVPNDRIGVATTDDVSKSETTLASDGAKSSTTNCALIHSLHCGGITGNNHDVLAN